MAPTTRSQTLPNRDHARMSVLIETEFHLIVATQQVFDTILSELKTKEYYYGALYRNHNALSPDGEIEWYHKEMKSVLKDVAPAYRYFDVIVEELAVEAGNIYAELVPLVEKYEMTEGDQAIYDETRKIVKSWEDAD